MNDDWTDSDLDAFLKAANDPNKPHLPFSDVPLVKVDGEATDAYRMLRIQHLDWTMKNELALWRNLPGIEHADAFLNDNFNVSWLLRTDLLEYRVPKWLRRLHRTGARLPPPPRRTARFARLVTSGHTVQVTP